MSIKIDDIDKQKNKNKQISDSEYTLIYIPETPLAGSLHKVSVSFKDSSGEDITKEWTITISGTQQGDTFNIFGFEIPKRNYIHNTRRNNTNTSCNIYTISISSLWKEYSKPASAENMYFQNLYPYPSK